MYYHGKKYWIGVVIVVKQQEGNIPTVLCR